jgi:transcriptional regulator with XRE-family HTH domain
LARQANVSPATIAAFELGERRPYGRTLKDLIAAFEAAGVVFIEPREDAHTTGIALKWGVAQQRADTSKGTGAAKGEGDGGLDALEWDWDDYGANDLEPLPPLKWSEEDKRAQIEHWRARPEAWAKLHEASRQCLLRAMGVEQL